MMARKQAGSQAGSHKHWLGKGQNGQTGEQDYPLSTTTGGQMGKG